MATTLKKLISQVDKTKPFEPNWEKIAEALMVLDLCYSEDKRLTCFFIKKWYCTDTFVGIRAYFLDEEFVAISHQVARKAYEEFYFVSTEVAKKVREYLLSLNDKLPRFELIDEKELNAEIPEYFSVEDNSQILHKSGYYKGEKVEILRTHYPYSGVKEESWLHFHGVEIELPNKSKKVIDCRELQLEYNQ